jgi:hypothetical protein
VSAGDNAVFAVAIAGAVFVGGMMIGEARARQQIATVCEPQPGAALASSVQSSTGLLCIYTDQIQTGRAQRRQKARQS